jgi:hypothetical protein
MPWALSANSSVCMPLMSVTSPIADSARFTGLESMIGNTPLLAIDYEMRGRRRTIYAKSEQMNLTGSIKDRMALHILRQAYAGEHPAGRHHRRGDQRQHRYLVRGAGPGAGARGHHLHA